MKTHTFRISIAHFSRLMSHLFPGDNDEHGAIVVAGICESKREMRLLARDVFLAKDGIDYVQGKYGYRALTANFVARISDYCARERLCYFAVHCHSGSDSVEFSTIDLNSHARGYPALLDITNGGPVGALVFAHNAVAGSIWTRKGIFPLESFTVIGANIRRLYPSRRKAQSALNPIYDRQACIFGAEGQELLAQTKVGIIGLGGAGSLISEWLAHLGVGEIVGVDFEKIEPTNQPRIVGSRPRDAQVFLSTSRWKHMQRLGRLLAKYKVDVARRTARRANPRVRYNAVAGSIAQRDIALLLKDVDFLFLCADSAQSRHVFNALVHQYLLPGIQVGSKVPVDRVSGLVGEIFTVSRPVLPYAGGGCLWCNELISSAKLQEEAITENERHGQAYVEEASVTAPSVITLNAVACAPAINDFLLGYFGLLRDHAHNRYAMQFSRDRDWRSVECRAEETCLHCGTKKASILARGDRADLPCK